MGRGLFTKARLLAAVKEMSQRSTRLDPKERRKSSLQVNWAELAFAKTSGTVTRYREKKIGKMKFFLETGIEGNYRENEITKIAIILEYVVLDFLNRFMDVAIEKWVHNAIGSSDYGLKITANPLD